MNLHAILQNARATMIKHFNVFRHLTKTVSDPQFHYTDMFTVLMGYLESHPQLCHGLGSNEPSQRSNATSHSSYSWTTGTIARTNGLKWFCEGDLTDVLQRSSPTSRGRHRVCRPGGG